mgnify:CR=1 FL=1
MRDSSCALSELQIIARNYDWFFALFALVVIGCSNCFGFGFSKVIWKLLDMYLLVSSERKPNFELTSLPFGINVPVYDNTSKFQHFCKDTKMTSPQLIIFQEH